MKILKDEINNYLNTIIDSYENSLIKEAMKYSLLAPGKRIRPIIMLQVIRSYSKQYLSYLPVACAIEMIHCYSLIHDDLPAMDNDDYRRGRLTCHKKFNEATAILAGDALLNEAVNVIIATDIDSNTKIKLINTLYKASGLNGMINGQGLDLQFEDKDIDLESLKKIHHDKTGAMLAASFKMGSIIANEDDQNIWEEIGYLVGLAFQIQDDILDVTSTFEKLGKPIGSDLTNNKSTYVKILGLDKSKLVVDKLLKEVEEKIYSLKINHGLILGIIESIRRRDK